MKDPKGQNLKKADFEPSLTPMPGLLDGNADWAAIDYYLGLKSAAEIVSLVRPVASNLNSPDTDAVVKNSLEQTRLAGKSLIRLRETLAADMSLETLWALAGRLGIQAITLPTRLPALLRDPVAGPVLRQIQKLESEEASRDDDEEPFINKNYRKILEEASARTELDRPSLPCNLDKALRYVTEIPVEFPADALDRVFREFLRVFPIRTAGHRRFLSESAKALSPVMVDQLAERLAEGSVRGAARIQLKSDYKLVRRTIAWTEEAKHFREQFSPGAKAPRAMTAEAVVTYAKYWAGEKPVVTEDRLAWLAENFHPFWAKHGSRYVDLQSVAQAKEMEGRLRMAAGTANRDQPKWIARTKGFVDYLQKESKDEKSLSAALIPLLVNKYKEELLTSKPPHLADKRTVESLTSFLSVLSRHATAETSGTAVGSVIRRELKAVPTDATAEATAEKTTIHLSQGKPNKPKKPKKTIIPSSDSVSDEIEIQPSPSQPKKSKKRVMLSYDSVSEETVIKCLNILRRALGKKIVPLPFVERDEKRAPAKKSPAKAAKKQVPIKKALRQSWRSKRKA